MKITLTLLLLLTAAFMGAKAQSCNLKGILQNEGKRPLNSATVTAQIYNDSTIVFRTATDRSGAFEFKELPAGIYNLTASFVGYDSLQQRVILTDRSQDLGVIVMERGVKTLSEVVVKSIPPPVTQKTDTLEYNASQFKVNPDAQVEDMIKKMPGITVDKSGTVTAQGETVQKITVDGKDFFGDDATAALRNLPAEIIDKIQVFDRMSEQAQFTGTDDGNSVKAINIVTKSGIKNGQFGRVFAGYGTDDTYAAGGNVSVFNGDRRFSLVGNFNNVNQQNFGDQDLLGVTSSGSGRSFGGGNFGGGNRGGGGGGRGSGNRGGFGGFGGGENFTVGQQPGISKTNSIGLNYGDKWSDKINVTGSYFYNNRNNDNDQLLKSQTTYPEGVQYVDQTSSTGSRNYNHRFNMRFEYQIDSSNSLIITPSLNFQKNSSGSHSIAQMLFDTDTTNVSDVTNLSDRNGYNLRNNILYRHAFAKKGRTLSINLTTTLNKNDGDNYLMGNYRFFDASGVPTDSVQNQFATNPTSGYTLSSNIAYTEPIGKKGQLQISYAPSYAKNKADQQTFLLDPVGGKYTVFDETLSNKFDNTTTVHNGGITYRLGASRDNQLAIGVNVQHSTLESQRIFPTASQVDQSFTTVLPNLMWRRKISKRSSANVFYRANTNFPSVSQLQDVANISNPLRVSIGNPELKQSFTNFLGARYSFTNTARGQSFFANVFLQAADNYISNASYLVREDSLIEQNTKLAAGSTLSKPVNLNGYKNLRTFLTYSQPVKFIKSNINLNTGFSYSRLPGLSNNFSTVTNNYTYNAGVVIASNVSEYVDFNLSYNVNFNNARTIAILPNINKYTNQAAGIQFNLLSKSGWFLQNDMNNQRFSGLSNGLNQSYWLWNAAIGKKFLADKAAELKLSVFDLLKQNQSITRTVSENYIEDVQNRMLQQYFMLTFTYKLKNFGKKKVTPERGDREPGFMGSPPPGGFGGPPPGVF